MRVFSATSDVGLVDPVEHRISSALVVLAHWLYWLKPIVDCIRLGLNSHQRGSAVFNRVSHPQGSVQWVNLQR